MLTPLTYFPYPQIVKVVKIFDNSTSFLNLYLKFVYYSLNSGPDMYGDGSADDNDDDDDANVRGPSTSVSHRKEKTPQQV